MDIYLLVILVAEMASILGILINYRVVSDENYIC